MVNTFQISQQPDPVDYYISPHADQTGCTELTPYGDSPNYACVDDPRENPDEDSTYVYTVSPTSEFDLYETPGLLLLAQHPEIVSSTINYIQVSARAKSHEYRQAGTGVYHILMSKTAVCTDIHASDDIDLITEYTTYTNTWTTNPITSLAWTAVDLVLFTIGVKASSPNILLDKVTTFRPNAAGTYCGLEGQLCPNCPGEHGGGDHFNCVRDFDNDYASSVNLDTGCPGCHDTYATDTFHIPDHTTETGVIDKVVIVGIMGKSGTCDGVGTLVLVTGDGKVWEYDTVNLPNPWETGWGTFAEELTTNPTTGVAWTWNDIDNLEIGYELHVLCDGAELCFTSYCNQVYLLVYYTETDNPEIRTTQMYARINVSPPTDYCQLNRPNQISNDHSRNIKMINFWSGNREVYDLNRSGKSMVLTGTEFYQPKSTDVCARIECVRDMAELGSPITITDLGSTLWNGTYHIRSFGWKKRNDCPEWYEWILDLEDTRHSGYGCECD
jgi:hypothetical protein